MISAKAHLAMVAETGCIICLERDGTFAPCEVHHVAEGSGKRSDYATAGLCTEHHRGATGIHGMGVKGFLRLWGLSSEYDLLALVNKWRQP